MRRPAHPTEKSRSVCCSWSSGLTKEPFSGWSDVQSICAARAGGTWLRSRERASERGGERRAPCCGDHVIAGPERSAATPATPCLAGVAERWGGGQRLRAQPPGRGAAGRVWPRPSRGLDASGPLTLGGGSANAATVVSSIAMSALKGHVEKNGRVVLDEPMDLPEGATVEIQGLRVIEDDGIAPEDRQKILHAIDEGLAAARRGDHVDADEFINELLAES
jgi:hypothetical protein